MLFLKQPLVNFQSGGSRSRGNLGRRLDSFCLEAERRSGADELSARAADVDQPKVSSTTVIAAPSLSSRGRRNTALPLRV